MIASCLAHLLARNHAYHPEKTIFIFLVVTAFLSAWLIVIPTEICTDVKALLPRGTKISGRDGVVEALSRKSVTKKSKRLPRRPKSKKGGEKRHIKKSDITSLADFEHLDMDFVSFLFETVDPSNNVFESPYSSILCEVQNLIEKIPIAGGFCAVINATGMPMCAPLISVVDMPAIKKEVSSTTVNDLIRIVSSPLVASQLVRKIKPNCISFGVPPCNKRHAIGCNTAHCDGRCIVAGGIDFCGVLKAIDPTEIELKALSNLTKLRRLDEKGCLIGKFNQLSFQAFLVSLNSIIAFEQRSGGTTFGFHYLESFHFSAFVSKEAAQAAKSGVTEGEAIASNITRIIFPINPVPFRGNQSVEDMVQTIGSDVIAFANDHGLRASWGHFKTFNKVFLDSIFRDAKRAIYVVLFVSAFILWHTKSGILTIGALLCVASSFPLAGWIYRVAFDFHWVGVFAFIALFLTIGIAVDDVFVLLDYWRAAPSETYSTIEGRLEWALEHSIVSMGSTSITTAAAFGANMLSPIPTIRLFGMIMALLSLVNYIVVLLVFPSFIMLEERRIKHISYAKLQPIKEMSQAIFDWVFRNAEMITCISLLFYAIVLSIAVKVKGPDALIEVFPEDHNMQRYYHMEQKFDGTGVVLEPIFVWGAISHDQFDVNDPVNAAPIELDQSFDLETEESQQWILDFCTELFSKSSPFSAHVLPGSLRCFHFELQRWLHTDKRRTLQGSALPDSLPLRKHEWRDAVAAFLASPSARQVTTGTSGLYFEENEGFRVAAFEISFRTNLSIWSPWKENFQTLTQWDDWFERRLESAPTGLQRGFLATNNQQWSKVEALQILAPSVIVSVAASALLAFFVLLLGTKSLSVTIVAVACMSGVLTSFLAFMYLAAWSMNMIESCCVGLIYGLSVDYVAHVSIGFCNAPVSRPASTAEVENTERSFNEKREEAEQRCWYAIDTIGDSVSSGMVTTVGASFFLWSCEVLFLSRFGLFVAFSLLSALFVSLFLFPALIIAFRILPTGKTLQNKSNKSEG